jgi:hypothetical protein
MSLADRGEYLAVKSGSVPDDLIEQGDAPVGEAMHGVEIDPGAVESPEYAATRLGSEIDGEEGTRGRHSTIPRRVGDRIAGPCG